MDCSMKLETNMPGDKIIFSFTVLWRGWECDSMAWVMERPNGTRYLLMTDHGVRQGKSINVLYGKLTEYESLVADTKHAIDLLLETKNG